MIELPSAQFATVPPLDGVPIFTGFVPMVFGGLIDGRVWCEDGAAHAWHGYGMSLIWGEGVGRRFDTLIEHLNGGAYRDKDEWLQIDPRWGHLAWDRRLKAERFGRVNFRFDRTLFAAHHSAPVLPPGWSIRPLSEAAFDLADVHVTPRAFWRSFASFVDHGGGVCAERDGEEGAIAFTATRGDGWLEIGIETRAAFRGRGLARAVAVTMIAKCLAAGLTPVWACRKENTGSLNLAQSLGFVMTKVVPFWRLTAHGHSFTR